MDTLAYYAETDNDGCGYWYSESVSGYFPTNAFEMLKFSGSMRQIKNKELLQDIWRAYAQIEAAKQNLDRFFQRKEEEIERLIQLIEDGKTIGVPMRKFYTHGAPFEMVRWCEQTSKRIKKTLSKFE